MSPGRRRGREERADAVVVGGGPGGSVAATLLAKSGHDVVLLEREEHPRHQIGESLLPTTIHGICRLIEAWDDVHAAGFVRKRGGTFRWGRSPDPFTFAFKNYAFQVERARFDALLFENASRLGVDARERVTVHEPVRENGRVSGVIATDARGEQVVFRAPYVIDASGHGSRLARHVGKRVYSEFFRNVAVYGYFRGARRLPPPNSGNVISSAFEHGWCWFIPLSDELTSVGAVVDHRHAREIQAGREAALMRFVKQCPIVDEYLSTAVRLTEGMYGEVRIRKDWSYTTDRLAVPGLLLVGDAGCFIDPLFSSGVHLATYGALLAARTVSSALAGAVDEPSCVREFERRYRREFAVWFDFLLAFSDIEQDWPSYFWAARSLLKTNERANEAFIHLVAEGGTTPEDFFGKRYGMGTELAELIHDAVDDGTLDVGEILPPRQPDSPLARVAQERGRVAREVTKVGEEQDRLFDDGLVPTEDGLRWRRPSPAPATG